jgi:hypothetical protein
MSVSMEQSDDQALRKSGRLRSVHGISDGLVERAYRSVDVLVQRERVAQAGDVAHLQNLAPRFCAFENVARITELPD